MRSLSGAHMVAESELLQSRESKQGVRGKRLLEKRCSECERERKKNLQKLNHAVGKWHTGGREAAAGADEATAVEKQRGT